MFWVVLAVVGACGGCSLLTGAVLFLGLFTTDSVTAPTVTAASSGKIATGETPGLYPGTPGWLPSGRGVPIPESQVVDGRPEGLWWRFQLQTSGRASAFVFLFLEDGTRATFPRPGGGVLFDIEGQRKQPGTTGLGTYEVGEGTITQHHDGFDSTDPLTWGTDDGGPWMKIGGAKYGALEFANEDHLLGEWVGAGSKFVFHDDGSYESGQIVDTGEWVGATSMKGTWQLDGYLIEFRPQGAPSWIGTVAKANHLLLINTTVYSRE